MATYKIPALKLNDSWRDLQKELPRIKNDLALRAARGEKTERAPVWVMRQAGRYLPEFLEVRKHHSFFECCRRPELASKLTLQPIDRYPNLDASIIFCDILVVPQALGMEVLMEPSKGPVLPAPLRSPSDLARLPDEVDVQQELGYVFDAVTMTRKGLDGRVPLIGFCGAPWTLMAYMCEGGGSKTFEHSKSWLYKWPEEAKGLLHKIADVCADLLVGQVLAGASMLQVFDSWAGELTPHQFAEFALPPLVHISRKVNYVLTHLGHPAVPMILFPRNVHSPASLALLRPESIGYSVIGLDQGLDPVEAHAALPGMNLQGNFDPAILYGGRDGIEREVKRVCDRFHRNDAGWIANLGHGITPNVKPDDMGWFLECVHKYSKRA